MHKYSFCFFLVLTLFFSCADYDMLEEYEREPEPVHLSISAVGDSTVTLVWDRSEEEDFQNYQVYYSLSDVVDTTSTLSATLTFRQDTSRIVRNLIPGKRYYFRVVVSTVRGLLSISNTVDTVTTTKGKITLHAPDQITSSSVRLHWTPSESSNSLIYEIYQDTVQSVDRSDILAVSVSDTTVTIEPLQSDKTYWFRIYGMNNNEVTAVSNTISAVPTGE